MLSPRLAARPPSQPLLPGTGQQGGPYLATQEPQPLLDVEIWRPDAMLDPGDRVFPPLHLPLGSELTISPECLNAPSQASWSRRPGPRGEGGSPLQTTSSWWGWRTVCLAAPGADGKPPPALRGRPEGVPAPPGALIPPIPAIHPQIQELRPQPLLWGDPRVWRLTAAF